jgi:hypothetical protein
MTWKPLLFFALIFSARGDPPLIKDQEHLEPTRRELIETSLKAVGEHPDIPYRYGGSAPEEGGMDCSGAVYYLLGKVGIDPPRSAQAQYDWVKKSGKLTVVPPDAKEGDPIFDRLQPGDLLFWAALDEAKEPRISHVQIYLGREIKDDLPVMIGASDGRSYRGTKKNGFGIVDFRVPKADSQRKLVGFGPPVWKKAAKTKA